MIIWVCISWLGAGEMSRVTGRMNLDQLFVILNTCLVQTMGEVAINLFFNARNDVIFQQENDAKHTSRATKNWLAFTSITIMNWSSQSPDLNPI